MYRPFIVIALVATLIACTDQGDGTPDQSPAVSTPVGSPGATGAADASPSADCTDSFAAVEAAGVASVTELGDLQEEVQATVESCESLDEWTAAAEQVIGDDINPNTAALLLRMQCGDPSLSNTPLCEELASS